MSANGINNPDNKGELPVWFLKLKLVKKNQLDQVTEQDLQALNILVEMFCLSEYLSKIQLGQEPDELCDYGLLQDRALQLDAQLQQYPLILEIMRQFKWKVD